MGAPAIFEKQIEIKLLHSASTEGVTDSGICYRPLLIESEKNFRVRNLSCLNSAIMHVGSICMYPNKVG
ncbi:MAG: hypothetical protein P8X74_16045 [Reinekea sp.]